MAAQRVVRELEVIALADEHAERAVALARSLRWLGEPAREQLERGLHLPRVVLLADRRGDDLAVDPEREQLALDALGAPGVEAPAVVGEALRVARVVEVALLGQLGEDR